LAKLLSHEARSAIEEKLTRLYHDLQAEAMDLNPDGILRFLSDEYQLGVVRNGKPYSTMDDFVSSMRGGYAQTERMEEKITALRAVALSPDVGILTVEKTYHAIFKDGSAITSPIVQTYVAADIRGEWKFVHWHMSTPA